MKIPLLLIATLFSISAASQTQKVALKTSPRSEKIINSNWTFNYFPSDAASKGYEITGFDDSRWTAISLPHTWNTYETTGELHPFIMKLHEDDNLYWRNGWGWYRKHFTVTKDITGQKVFIEFEGVQKYCKVWINGSYLGDHAGGYGSFDFDITPYIKKGGDNVIAVAVSNKINDQLNIPPMLPSAFNVYGGIYRNVTIVLKNNLHIPMQGSASHEGGTFITTPGFAGGSGIVRIQTWVKNDNLQQTDVTLQSTILDAAGKTVQVIRSVAGIKPGQVYRFDQSSKTIKNPALWSPGKPVLYTVYSEVLAGALVTDTYTSSFGFRWFRWNEKEKMLYVNNIRTELRGVFRHQDYPWLGDALPGWITENDLKDISGNIGFNFLRTSFYPSDKSVYEYADLNGIIVEEGIPVTGNQDFSMTAVDQQIKEMIRRDRNHPSILFWRNGINTSFSVDRKLILAEDTSRIIAIRSESSLHTDVDKSISGFVYAPADQLNTEEGIFQENLVKSIAKSGIFSQPNQASWLYNAHGSPEEDATGILQNADESAISDIYRFPVYAYYLLKAIYSDEPVLFILPHFWTEQHLGEKHDVAIITNCEKVELKVNGIVKGTNTLSKDNNCITVFNNIETIKGRIDVAGTWKGKSVNSKIEMPSSPAKIVLSTEWQKINADRSSLAIVRAQMVDSKGNNVSAGNILKWNVTGPAMLAGPDVYVSEAGMHELAEGTGYINTPVANIIRSTGEPGKITVIVSAAGIASGSLEITAENAPVDNSVFSEPPLRNEGRRSPDRAIISGSLDEIPAEIRSVNENISLQVSANPGYRKAVAAYIFKNNPAIDTTTVEFSTLSGVLAYYLANNNGQITSWDYNFNINNYNKSKLIAGYVLATKLPQQYKDALRTYYSELVIQNGKAVNAGDEMNWLNWIPSGGTVVIYNAGEKIAAPKGVLVTDKSELTDLITLVHPNFQSFSQDGKLRAVEFISKMNPLLIREIPYGGETPVLKARKGKPVLIPLYKFIAE
ncbi:MAG TPA: glycoside hydrolase family 2 TIM barrel-domain containing protein [Bacteroidales bacterium]|nr:glycoside hydrolase family 2 TIM barrel-domain containing protein [Bacteroidales bacterium]